jgi:hypothetical protein
MDYEASLAYDDDEYGSDSDPTKNTVEEAKAVDSMMGQLVVVILNGSVPTHAIGTSGSNFVEGRVPDICPALNPLHYVHLSRPMPRTMSPRAIFSCWFGSTLVIAIRPTQG